MQLRQSYESTITNGNQTLHFFVLPKRSFSTKKPYEPSSVLTIFQLNFRKRHRSIRLTQPML
jgi:hypothetical protein